MYTYLISLESYPSLIGFSLLVIYAFQRISILASVHQQRPRDITCCICLIQPMSMLGAAIPTSWWNLGVYFTWLQRETLYVSAKSETIMYIPLLWGIPSIYSSSRVVAQQVLGVGSAFTKSAIAKLGIGFFGDNVVASTGDVWRRHRKITVRGFHQSTYELVWEETSRLYYEMIKSDDWKVDSNGIVNLRSITKQTSELALYVISSCGFGEPVAWNQDSSSLDGLPSMTESIRDLIPAAFSRVIVPSWVFYLPFKKLQHINQVFRVFEQSMRHKIALQKEELQKCSETSRRDVFTQIILASERDGTLTLQDDEVLSNCFAFLFAGHETTAHTMATLLAILAVNTTEQERVYKSICDVTDKHANLSFSDYKSLGYVLACFYEAVRLYPPAFVALRDATEDVMLEDGPQNIHVQKGTQIVLDMIGTNRNPKDYPNPHEFIPSRWNENFESAMTFSYGPRNCLGRKFATTEAACFLTLLLRDWEVSPIKKDGETDHEWLDRVLQPKLEITLHAGDIPLRLKRRGHV